MLGRLVIIGDVHTEATRLALVLAHARRIGADAVLCVGDIVDGPEDAGRCIELLRDHEVLTVRGNHERWLLEGHRRDEPGFREVDLAAGVGRWYRVGPDGLTTDGVVDLARLP